MNLRKMVASILSVSLISSVVAISSASAYYTLGGKYASGTITYTFQGLTANYTQAMANGIAAWNNANTDVTFTSQSDVTKANIIFRQDAYGNVGWNARCANKPVHTSGTYTRSDIDFNTSQMDGMTVAKRQGTSAHELGHAIGLDHTGLTDQVMCTAGDGRTVNAPNWDDRAGANGLY